MPMTPQGQATAPPAPAATATTQDAGSNIAVVLEAPAGATPAQVYQGLRAQRRELLNQVESLEDSRGELIGRLREGTVSDADRAGLDQRLAVVDQQLAAKQIALGDAEAKLAMAASIPGATIEPTRPPETLNANDVAEMSAVIFTILAIPLVLAWARRIWRRSSVTINLPAELSERLTSLERSIDTVAVEVERIGEGQRFVTQLMADRARPAERLARGGDEGHV